MEMEAPFDGLLTWCISINISPIISPPPPPPNPCSATGVYIFMFSFLAAVRLQCGCSAVSGPFLAYPDILKTEIFFFSVFKKKKIRSTRSVFESSVFARPNENPKTMKIRWHPYGACVVLEVYDA